MWGKLEKGRRAARRALRPTVDGLEPKHLLTTIHPAAARGRQGFVAAGGYTFQTAYGGKIVQIKAPDGGVFNVSILTQGSIRARPLPNRTVALIVDGTNSDSVLTVDVNTPNRNKGTAHTYRGSKASPFLKVGQVIVTTGQINQILGYRDANLYGPINIAGTAPVDRIAFTNLMPGASIRTGGDLNTLDVLNNIDLTTGPGIQIGDPAGTLGDLNAMNVGQDVNLSGGASIRVTRDLGLTPQIPKGSGPAGVGASIGGDLTIDQGSVFAVGRRLAAQFSVFGNVNEPGATNLFDRITFASAGPNASINILGNFPGKPTT